MYGYYIYMYNSSSAASGSLLMLRNIYIYNDIYIYLYILFWWCSSPNTPLKFNSKNPWNPWWLEDFSPSRSYIYLALEQNRLEPYRPLLVAFIDSGCFFGGCILFWRHHHVLHYITCVYILFTSYTCPIYTYIYIHLQSKWPFLWLERILSWRAQQSAHAGSSYIHIYNNTYMLYRLRKTKHLPHVQCFWAGCRTDQGHKYMQKFHSKLGCFYTRLVTFHCEFHPSLETILALS